MKKFKAVKSSFNPCVKSAEVERETKDSVWVNGRRYAKITEYESYFDDFESAKRHLVEHYKKGVDQKKRSLQVAEEIYVYAKDLKNPDGEK